MIKHHPSASVLREYVAGSLDPATSLMVTAHCEMCHECASLVQTLSENYGTDLEADSTTIPGIDREFVTMLDDILANDIEQSHSARWRQPIGETPKIEVDGKSFSVPKVLGKFVEKDLTWSKYLGRLSHANVNIGGGNLAQFIFMESGAGVPEHTHKGNEITLVLDGEFSDGLSVYKNGDLTFMNGEHRHSPAVETEEGCLVFSIIDQPLQFTNNWARIINPLSSLFFHANIDKR